MTFNRPDLATAIAHQRAGRLAEAEEAYRAVLAVDPRCSDAWHLLGVLDLRRGKFESAATAILRAIDLNPSSPEMLNTLGVVYMSQNRVEEAIDAFQAAVQLPHAPPAAKANLDRAVRRQQSASPAVTPSAAPTEATLVAESPTVDLALLMSRRAVEANPHDLAASFRLAGLLRSRQLLTEAEAEYRRGLALQPGQASARYNLANLLLTQHRFDEAEAAYRQAIESQPNFPEAFNNLATLTKGRGLVDETLAHYRQVIALDPQHVAAASNLLLTLQYDPGVSLTQLAVEHRAFNERHIAPLVPQASPPRRVKRPEDRIRLGIVSPDLGCHPVGYLSIRGLEQLDRRQVELYCYSDRTATDSITARFQKAATAWRTTAGQSSEQIAEQIRADEIDILYDLSGHTAGHRLHVFAHKPAPIQVTWLGYEGSTGVQTMDYLLADLWVMSPAAEQQATERVVRLRHAYVCYDPPTEAPPVNELPALERGYVTFGSFHNPAKLNAAVLDLWAEIMLRVPTARLLFKYTALTDLRTQQRIVERFVAKNVDPARLRFEDRSPLREYFARYHEIDLMLDPFPFCGGVTSCESLWMGVPIITWPQARFASRHTFSFLTAIGYYDTIARGAAHYVELAAAWAADLPRLAHRRANLRSRMAASPLCDGRRFAYEFLAVQRLLTEQNGPEMNANARK